jgi:LAO/AO transport system kinase
LSEVENRGPRSQDLLRALFPFSGKAQRLGVTGAPGAGKSTLVSRLCTYLRLGGHRVAIIAVDPTSPFSGGSILGDRVRMQSHYSDDSVFIRSMAARGSLGGLAPATADVMLVLEAAGFSHILIETVGVGQAEVEVARLASVVTVVLTPAAGDDVQALKAGIMEIADVFVINKADLPGADRLESEVEATWSSGGTTSRRSCQAASSSAWPSPGPSPNVRRCCCATSRPGRSTSPPASSSSTPCSGSTSSSGRRPW